MQVDGGRGDAGPVAPAPQAPTGPPAISVVVPVLNGEELLAPARESLARALEGTGRPFELVFVDDGSTDGTWPALGELVDLDPRVRAVRLAANVGQAPAIATGIGVARGEVIITTDVDLETDAADLPLLLAAVEEGHPVVSGRRTSPRRWEREVPSRLFNRYARARGVDLHDIGCGTNALRRDAALAYAAVPDIRRELPSAILHQVSGDVLEVGMRSRRPDGSQISARQLVMLWVAFERRRGRPAAATAVIAGLGAVAAATAPRRSLRVLGIGFVGAGAAWWALDRALDGERSSQAPVVVEQRGLEPIDTTQGAR